MHWKYFLAAQKKTINVEKVKIFCDLANHLNYCRDTVVWKARNEIMGAFTRGCENVLNTKLVKRASAYSVSGTCEGKKWLSYRALMLRFYSQQCKSNAGLVTMYDSVSPSAAGPRLWNCLICGVGIWCWKGRAAANRVWKNGRRQPVQTPIKATTNIWHIMAEMNRTIAKIRIGLSLMIYHVKHHICFAFFLIKNA